MVGEGVRVEGNGGVKTVSVGMCVHTCMHECIASVCMPVPSLYVSYCLAV